ncbi:response regulator [Alteromonas sp. ZYF713]|nr:response regulator [Alteromonas sp. ZYF713]
MTDEQTIHQAVLENLGEALIIIDNAGVIEHFTYAAEQLFLYDRKEVVGKNVSLLMPQDIGRTHQHYVSAYSSKERSTALGKTRELLAVRKNGEQFPVEITVTQATVGTRRLFVGLLKDITEKVNTFKALSEAKIMADIANNAKSEFLGNMCHEIRTPMNGILGTLQLLKQRSMHAEDAKLVDIALTSSELLMRILNDILDFSKLEANKVQIENSPFLMTDMISDVVGNVQEIANKKGLTISVDCDVSPAEERLGDVVRVKQVLTNILSNAIKFTQAGAISLSIKTTSTTSIFTVKDTGIGMTKEQIATLCDRFSQADLSTTRNYGGTGLGMAIVNELIALMNGSLKVSSKLGVGTTMTVELPLVKSTSRQKLQVAKEQITAPDFAGKTILIAEDNDINRIVIEELLKPTGAILVIVTNGKQVVDYCKKSHVDVVLTDINMPVMGGEESLEKLRHAGFSKPVIALTANASIQQVEHYLSQGFDDVLSKPVFTELLHKVLNNYLRV